MDKHNLFLTPTTYTLLRLDYAVTVAAATGLVAMNYAQVDWGRFALAFAWPDVVGTFPGLYWYYRRARGERRSIPAVFPLLYNFGHSILVNAVVVAAWRLLSGGWEWAMLALPIHLAGDRAVFGNIFKPFGLAFEPVLHSAYERFQLEYERAGRW